MRKTRVAVIREELVAVTGDAIAALVLNQMLYWQQRVEDYDLMLAEEQARAPERFAPDVEPPFANGWFWKTARQLAEEVMLGEGAAKTVARHLERLVESGLLLRRRNPYNAWDKTYQYRVDLARLQAELHRRGYTLDGYTLDLEAPSVGHRDQPKGQIVPSERQIVPPKGQFVPAIPEITTETTTRDYGTAASCADGHGDASADAAAAAAAEEAGGGPIAGEDMTEVQAAVAALRQAAPDFDDAEAFVAQHGAERVGLAACHILAQPSLRERLRNPAGFLARQVQANAAPSPEALRLWRAGLAAVRAGAEEPFAPQRDSYEALKRRYASPGAVW